MSVHGEESQDGQQAQPAQRGLTPRRIAALWAIGLIWIVAVSTFEGDLRTGLYGTIVELLAVIACIHITQFIRADHDEHTRLYRVGLAERQPIVDVAGALQAGVLLGDYWQLRTDDRDERAPAAVYDITVRRRAARTQEMLTMRRPVAPVPPPRS